MAQKQIPELNYNIQIPKISALIQQWERRILTPIGRLTVLKSLIISKTNHYQIQAKKQFFEQCFF